MTTKLYAHEIEAQLEEAKRSLIKWEELKSSADRVKALTEQLDNAKQVEAARLAFEMNIARCGMSYGLNNLSITENQRTSGDDNFIVSYTRDEWSDELSKVIQVKSSHEGFAAVPAPVLVWMAEHCPAKLPTSILELVPGYPKAACNKFISNSVWGQ